MPDDDATDFIFRHRPVQDQAERHENPGQVRRRKDEQAQEAQPRLRVPPAPYVDQRAREREAEERYAEHGREA